jgi:hypothetical protein
MTSLARLMAVVLILVCACGGRQIHWATAAEHSALTTRSFPAHAAVALRRAVVVALRLQGFQVIVTEPMVRTAPKHVMTSSTAFTDQNTAYASSDVQTLAWDATISRADGTVVVSLLPARSLGRPARFLICSNSPSAITRSGRPSSSSATDASIKSS